MKFLRHVVFKLIVPLVLGVLLIGAVAVVVILTQAPAWIDPVADALVATSRAGFTLRASTAAAVVDRTDEERRRRYTTALAGRLSNLGVLYKDLNFASQNPQGGAPGRAKPLPLNSNQQKAVDLFSRALELHRSVDNVEGIAQTSGNLRQLYLDANENARAEELIRDTFDKVRKAGERLASGVPDPIAMQFACMNMGYLADRLGRPHEAVTWYTYVLQRFSVVVSFVQRTCAAELAVSEVAVPLFGDLGGRPAPPTPPPAPRGEDVLPDTAFAREAKNVWFVLDVSGSMDGAFIEACRESIKSIINSHCTEADAVALTVFHSFVEPVFALEQRTSEALPRMLRMVDEGTNIMGATGFYSALLNVLQQSVGMIAITVGMLPNAPQIQALLDAVPGGRDHAVMIKADTSGGSIKQTFVQAVRVIGGALVVESL
ncbi:hypothetical protein HK405_010091, partial [Cladochytrium tenue]